MVITLKLWIRLSKKVKEREYVTIELDDTNRKYLIDLLQDKYYQTTDMQELSKINQIFKILNVETESWILEL